MNLSSSSEFEQRRKRESKKLSCCLELKKISRRRKQKGELFTSVEEGELNRRRRRKQRRARVGVRDYRDIILGIPDHGEQILFIPFHRSSSHVHHLHLLPRANHLSRSRLSCCFLCSSLIPLSIASLCHISVHRLCLQYLNVFSQSWRINKLSSL